MSSTSEDKYHSLRHSAAHLMAQAVGDLFPGVKYAIGPPIEDGFYYDFLFPTPIKEEDLSRIEARMRELSEADLPIVRKELPRAEAMELCEKAGQPFKVELIRDLPDEETISFYEQGNWSDLCKGPHVPSTGHVKHFKLLSIAGAYWRGDEKNPMLTRIYGTAWETAEELEEYLHRLEEARKRDHRRLGKDLGLFLFAPEDVGQGIPLFLPRGETLRHIMESYVRETQARYGYQHVWTAHLVREELYKKSGHLDNYSDVMFPPMVDEDDGVRFRLKPMNCPSHITLFNLSGLKSYRDLPVRYAEFATLYRYEKTGELTGLTRVRALTQDDCHIFCTEDQVEEEFSLALRLVREVLGRYGFHNYRVRLSLRGEEPGGKYVQDDEKWARATEALRRALEANNVEYFEAVGEAAFYGPKADFQTRDVLGREWTASTIQVDFILPARLGCRYIASDGSEQTPVILHRAVTGSTERFMGLLIEHYAGAFPLWLAPVQVVVMPIADAQEPYAREIEAALKAAGYRVEVDARSERVGLKVREAEVQKVPYMVIVGKRDVENRVLSVRKRHEGDLGAMTLEAFLQRLNEERDAGV